LFSRYKSVDFCQYIFFLAVLCLLDTTVLLSCPDVFGQSAFEGSPITTDALVRPTRQPEIAPENNGEPPAAPSQQQPATGAANPGRSGPGPTATLGRRARFKSTAG